MMILTHRYNTTKTLILASACLSVSIAKAEQEKWADLTSHNITFNIDGLPALSATSSASYKLEDKWHRIGNKDKLIGEIQLTTEDTPFGLATVKTATYGTAKSPVEYTIKFKRLHALQAFTVQGFLHNKTDQDITFHSADLIHTGKINAPNADEWLITPLMMSKQAKPLSSMENGFIDAAMMYNPKGDGVTIGAVGPAEAYTIVEFRDQHLKAFAQMDDVLVSPGETRRSEEMVFSIEASTTATDLWTRWVAITHGTRQHQGPVYGWCSWYDRTTKIDAEHVLNVTKTIKENPNVFGKGIIQIDDGYQKMDGDWSANEKFPHGMASLAKEIRDAGCTPGVWFAPLMINPGHPFCEQHPDAIQKNAKGIASFMNANPFHPEGANWLNPDHPEAKKFLYQIIEDARERGFGYIKIDFNGIGKSFINQKKTRLQVFRDLYTLYRDAAGEEMYILSCLGQPTRGVVGFIDAARVGPDSHPAHFSHCLESVLRFQIFDNVWWQNDPDVTYLAPKLKSRRVGHTPQGEGMWRTWHAVNTLVGGTSMISEPINYDDVQAEWRNYEITRPSSIEPARLLTLGQSDDDSIYGFSANRTYGDFAVYNLYNLKEEERHITLRFDSAGLPTDQKCAVYDFWENKVTTYTSGSYNSRVLPQFSSDLVRITPLISGQPNLVGSNLHLSIGATEIETIYTTPDTVTVILNGSGAQQGDLTFYSEKPLIAVGAETCKVESVTSVGDNLYKVSLSGRQWDKNQTITLKY